MTACRIRSNYLAVYSLFIWQEALSVTGFKSSAYVRNVKVGMASEARPTRRRSEAAQCFAQTIDSWGSSRTVVHR